MGVGGCGHARGEGDSGAGMGMGSGTRRGGPWDPAGRTVGGGGDCGFPFLERLARGREAGIAGGEARRPKQMSHQKIILVLFFLVVGDLY